MKIARKNGGFKCLMCVCLLIGSLGCVVSADAGTATLTWDAYTPPADFKEIQWFRTVAPNCNTQQGPLAPLLINGVQATTSKPATGAFPTTLIDQTVPNVDGMLCYEARAVDTSGNFSTTNRASKVINLDPPGALLNLKITDVVTP